MPPLKPSTAADIEPSTEVIVLPYMQNGKALAVRVRALGMAEMAAAEGEAPFMVPDGKGGKITQDEVARLALRFRAIAKAGLVEPRLAFEPGEPGPRWESLAAGNQAEIAGAIYRLSGVGQSPDVEAAKSVVGFPAERGGKNNGADAGAPVRSRAAAAR